METRTGAQSDARGADLEFSGFPRDSSMDVSGFPDISVEDITDRPTVEVNSVADDVEADEALPGDGDGVGAGKLSDLERVQLRDLECTIDSGVASIGEALLEITDARLYRETHESFEAYVMERWRLKRSTAYDHVDAARVRRAIGRVELGHSQCVAISVLPQEQWAGAARAAAGMSVAETKEIVRQRRAKVSRSSGTASAGNASPESTPVEAGSDDEGGESLEDALLGPVQKHGQQAEGPRRPRVLDVVVRASEALAELDEDALGEELTEDEQGELEEQLAFIRERLELLDARPTRPLSMAAA